MSLGRCQPAPLRGWEEWAGVFTVRYEVPGRNMNTFVLVYTFLCSVIALLSHMYALYREIMHALQFFSEQNGCLHILRWELPMHIRI